ncbi:MAG: type II toxin-antitoxin system RelE/ParE family toxin [Rhizobiales bacterium]|nr:type II toxin-antitoxin system RelE/ParE family toxin [Hyphomicrobiales bacterium]
MIASFRSKALKRFWENDDSRGINPQWVAKIVLILDALDNAVTPAELDVATFGFHALIGDMAGRYAIRVTRNWRITFAWEGESGIEVDLEDYHGR